MSPRPEASLPATRQHWPRVVPILLSTSRQVFTSSGASLVWFLPQWQER